MPWTQRTILPFPSFPLLKTGGELILLVVLAILVVLSRRRSRLRDKDGNTIPRGPVGLPIVGSFPFLTHYPEFTIHRWAQRFGPIYSFWLGSNLCVVLSDPGIVKKIMTTTAFSSRKDMFMKAQTILLRRAVTGTQYNETWRKHRRLAASFVHPRMVERYTPSLAREASAFVQVLYDASGGGTEPINPQRYAGHCLLNNMLNITFGIRTESIDHPLVGKILHISREFMNCTGPLSNMIDWVPFLQHFPSRLHTRGMKLCQNIVSTYGDLVQGVRTAMQNGIEVEDSFTKDLLDVQEKEVLDDLDITMLSAAYMIAAVESPAGIIQWFSALIGTHPDVQRKAQEELDRVVGRDRMPTAEDENNLPYCRAIIKEVERYYNPFWLGTPHCTTEDVTYNGAFIPKDTVVICNTYSMHFDETRHPDPHKFNPDRYLHDTLTSSASTSVGDPYQRDHWMYGVGRRVCLGMLLADREVFLIISRMLWAFTMHELPDEPIDLKEYDGLSGRSPMPFRFRIALRHSGVVDVLQGELKGGV